MEVGIVRLCCSRRVRWILVSADIDPASGNSRVYVSARAQVWSLEKRLPKKVASVGPVQYAGLGPDDKVAMRNALNIAAKEAANEIVSILNAKGVR